MKQPDPAFADVTSDCGSSRAPGQWKVAWRVCKQGLGRAQIVVTRSRLVAGPRQAKAAAHAVARESLGGEVRISRIGESGRPQQVTVPGYAITRWDPSASELPEPVPTVWTQEEELAASAWQLFCIVREALSKAASLGILHGSRARALQRQLRELFLQQS